MCREATPQVGSWNTPHLSHKMMIIFYVNKSYSSEIFMDFYQIHYASLQRKEMKTLCVAQDKLEYISYIYVYKNVEREIYAV